jgi:hypothetical protein
MDQTEGPATIQVDDDPAHWEATQVDDVFLPAVRVSLSWRDVEAAVERGAVVPTQAHALWAAWAAPGSPLRQTAGTRQAPSEFQSTLSEFPLLEQPAALAPAPSLAARIAGPIAGMVVGALLTYLALGR